MHTDLTEGDAEILALFDRELRRDYPGDAPGDVVERDGDVVRQISGDSGGWSGVIWSDLDADSADAAIATQVRYFSDAGRSFEWKLYSHDHPDDLGERLARAGFVPEEPETLMIGDVDALPQEPLLPEGLRIEPVTDRTGVELMIAAHRAAFGPKPRTEQQLRQQVQQGSENFHGLVVLAGDEPVCAARMEFHVGTGFASLWGGGTAPAWRGRGIYRATVAHRAALAVARGFRYLQVDASPDSRPILARLGFRALSVTTPYIYEL